MIISWPNPRYACVLTSFKKNNIKSASSRLRKFSSTPQYCHYCLTCFALFLVSDFGLGCWKRFLEYLGQDLKGLGFVLIPCWFDVVYAGLKAIKNINIIFFKGIHQVAEVDLFLRTFFCWTAFLHETCSVRWEQYIALMLFSCCHWAFLTVEFRSRFVVIPWSNWHQLDIKRTNKHNKKNTVGKPKMMRAWKRNRTQPACS